MTSTLDSSSQPAQTDETTKAAGFSGVSRGKVGTLKPAIDAIPRECLERPTVKGAYVVVQSAVLYIASLIFPFSFDNIYAVIAGWVLTSLCLAGMFVVGHDAAHGSLFNSKRANKNVGRALFIPEAHSYEGWLLGHNRLHHGHTVREQMDFVWHPLSLDEYKSLSLLRKIQHKIEWSMFGAGVYYMRNVWWDKMVLFTPPERYRDRIKKDIRFVAAITFAIIAALAVGGFIKYDSLLGGVWLPIKMFAVPLFGFMTIIGWTVYVHHISPDIKWWRRSEWDSFKGQIEGTTILKLNPVINNLFFYNIFVHVPHHVDMRVPCYNLPKAGDALVEAFPEIKHKKLRFRDYINTTRRCKLYDFDSHTWLNYKGKVTAIVD